MWPSSVSKDIKTARNASGAKIFNPEGWLNPTQVACIFSRLSAKHKKNLEENNDIIRDTSDGELATKIDDELIEDLRTIDRKTARKILFSNARFHDY